MLITTNFYVALVLSIITMITWGTNKVAVKYLKYPVAFYTMDYFTWVFIFHIIFGFTIGSEWMPPEKDYGMISNIKAIINHDDAKGLWLQFGGPALAGASTAAFSLIMFVLTDGFGLTSAIPLLFGSAMLFGVIAAYYIEDPERRGNLVQIFIGVGILFLAILLNTIASSKNNKIRKSREEQKPLLEEEVKNEASTEPTRVAESAPLLPTSEPAPVAPAEAPVAPAEAPVAPTTESAPVPPTTETSEAAPAAPTTEATAQQVVDMPKTSDSPKLSMCMFVFLGLLGALFDFFYAPCTAMGSSGDIALSPYGVFLFVSFASFVVVFPISYIVMRHPIKGEKSTWSEYFHATWKQRWPAIWSAALLAIGNVCYATAGNALSTAISYALSRGTLLVSALLGITCYHEFRYADCLTWTIQITALVLFVVAIVIVAFAAKK